MSNGYGNPIEREARVGAMKHATIQVGDRIRDNDPRCDSRGMLTISRTDDPKYIYATDATGRELRYLRSRIFTDDKPRRTGFSLVSRERSS